MLKVYKDSELLFTLTNRVCNENKLWQRLLSSFKHIAAPRRYLWSIYVQDENGDSSFGPNGTKLRQIMFHCRATIYPVAYNSWLSFTATTCIIERQHRALNAQRQGIKYVYGKFHVKTARQVSHDSKLRKADDAEVTVSRTSAMTFNYISLQLPGVRRTTSYRPISK